MNDIPLPPVNEIEVLHALRRGLTRSTGFRLYFARVNSQHLREGVIAWTKR